jgi:hypothetical protein
MENEGNTQIEKAMTKNLTWVVASRNRELLYYTFPRLFKYFFYVFVLLVPHSR